MYIYVISFLLLFVDDVCPIANVWATHFDLVQSTPKEMGGGAQILVAAHAGQTHWRRRIQR